MNDKAPKRKREGNDTDSEDDQVCEKIKKIRINKTADIQEIAEECRKSCIDLTFVHNDPRMLEIKYSSYDPPFIESHYSCKPPTVYYNRSIVKLNAIDSWTPVYGLGDVIQELSKCVYYNTLTLVAPEPHHFLNSNSSLNSMEEE